MTAPYRLPFFHTPFSLVQQFSQLQLNSKTISLQSWSKNSTLPQMPSVPAFQLNGLVQRRKFKVEKLLRQSIIQVPCFICCR